MVASPPGSVGLRSERPSITGAVRVADVSEPVALPGRDLDLVVHRLDVDV